MTRLLQLLYKLGMICLSLPALYLVSKLAVAILGKFGVDAVISEYLEIGLFFLLYQLYDNWLSRHQDDYQFKRVVDPLLAPVGIAICLGTIAVQYSILVTTKRTPVFTDYCMFTAALMGSVYLTYVFIKGLPALKKEWSNIRYSKAEEVMAVDTNNAWAFLDRTPTLKHALVMVLFVVIILGMMVAGVWVGYFTW